MNTNTFICFNLLTILKLRPFFYWIKTILPRRQYSIWPFDNWNIVHLIIFVKHFTAALNSVCVFVFNINCEHWNLIFDVIKCFSKYFRICIDSIMYNMLNILIPKMFRILFQPYFTNFYSVLWYLLVLHGSMFTFKWLCPGEWILQPERGHWCRCRVGNGPKFVRPCPSEKRPKKNCPSVFIRKKAKQKMCPSVSGIFRIGNGCCEMYLRKLFIIGKCTQDIGWLGWFCSICITM